jgi:predicted permease
VALQVALSLPLIVAASLFSLSLSHARQVNFGIDPTNVAALSIDQEEAATPAENHQVHRRIQERLVQLPQVRSAAVIQTMPMRAAIARTMEVPGWDWDAHRPITLPFVNGVDPSFFDVMRLRFIAGRPFSSAENVPNGRPVLVINQAMARTFWQGQSPLGRCVKIGNTNAMCAEVIGVVADAASWPSMDFTVSAQPTYYVPIEQHRDFTSSRAVLIRTNDQISELLPLLRSQAQSTGANLPYVDVWAFDEVFQPALRPLRLGSAVFIAFGILGVLIAGVGLGAVTGYGVVRRTREFGIRLALGAEPRALVRQALDRCLVAVGLGLASGSVLAFGASRWLRSLLYGVAADDVRVYAAAGVLLAVVSALAAYVPARRAGRIDPASALRTE